MAVAALSFCRVALHPTPPPLTHPSPHPSPLTSTPPPPPQTQVPAKQNRSHTKKLAKVAPVHAEGSQWPRRELRLSALLRPRSHQRIREGSLIAAARTVLEEEGGVEQLSAWGRLRRLRALAAEGAAEGKRRKEERKRKKEEGEGGKEKGGEGEGEGEGEGDVGGGAVGGRRGRGEPGAVRGDGVGCMGVVRVVAAAV